jgi:pyruvate formate lyase activating enzyme
MSPEAVMAEIEPSLPFIRGLTVSGGECTLYPEFLRSLGALAKERGLSFFLDSNGNYDYEGDRELMAVTDSVMLDIKADPENPAEYRRVTGYNGEHLVERAEYLARTGKLWELRTVVSPGLFDAPVVVDRMCRIIAAVLKGGGPHAPPAGKEPRYKLIRYRPVGVRKQAAETLEEPGDALMETLAGICRGYGIEAAVV